MVTIKNTPTRRFFQYNIDKNVSECLIEGCNKTVKGNHAGNMLKHTKTYHLSEYSEILMNKSNELVDKTKKYTSSQESTYKDSKQSIIEYTKNNRESIVIRTNVEIVRDACIEMVTINGRPLKSLEDSGFRKILDPILKVFSNEKDFTKLIVNRKNIRDLIKEKANKIRENIILEVENKMVSLKLDCATRLNRSILGINIQFIKEERIVVRTLSMLELNSKHTAEYLLFRIHEVLNAYNIKLDQLYSVTTDSGANLLKMVRELSKDIEESMDTTEEHILDVSLENENILNDEKNSDTNLTNVLDKAVEKFNTKISTDEFKFVGIRCGAHTLQLAILDSLKEVHEIINHARNLVKKLRTPSYIYIIKQRKMCVPPLDCVTRWSSTYKMLESLLKNKNLYIELINTEYDADYKWIDWVKLEEIRNALEYSARATVIFQREQLIISDFYLEWLKCKYNTRKCNTKFSETVYENLEKRGIYYSDHVVIHSALFLDPRYQGLLSFDERARAKLHLMMLWSRIESLSDKEKLKYSSFPREKNVNSNNDDNFAGFIDVLKRKNKMVDGYKCIERDFNIMAVLEGFDGVSEIDSAYPTLKYWMEKKEVHPQLYLLTNVIYGAPATQVTVERAFSSLKYILSSLRENISEETLENILMIRLNWIN